MHIEDVASAVWAVAKSQVTGAVNAGSGDPVRVRAIVETIARLVGWKGAIEWGAVAEDPQGPPLLVADVRKLNQEAVWSPKYSLEAGLDHTIKWWSDNLEIGA